MIKVSNLATLICLASLTACTTSEAVKNTKDTPSAIANAPVKAANLKKREIPEFLQDLDNPYATPQDGTCQGLAGEIAQLTEFLGPDWDSDEHFSKKGRTSAEFFNAILPYGGLVRFASGASEHQKKVIYATNYGTARRAYLKTTSASRGCPSL